MKTVLERCNWRQGANLLLLSCMMLSILNCKPGGPGKRVTTVTGLVLDEANQPVDSVVVYMASAGFARPGLPLGETHTDKDGKYKLTIDVPKGYSGATVGIPFSLNESFTRLYKDYRVYQDGNELNTCCGVSIGSSVSYDFVLLLK